VTGLRVPASLRDAIAAAEADGVAIEALVADGGAFLVGEEAGREAGVPGSDHLRHVLARARAERWIYAVRWADVSSVVEAMSAEVWDLELEVGGERPATPPADPRQPTETLVALKRRAGLEGMRHSARLRGARPMRCRAAARRALRHGIVELGAPQDARCRQAEQP
jgi:hypothetical protein